MMEKISSKKVFIALTLALVSASTFALPGFEPFVPDSAGDFVYYRDTSFNRTSIIGFIAYGSDTYGARYYSPADKKAKTLAKDITVYFSLDGESENITFTGERIVGANDSGDTEIVNYIHSLLYGFDSCRKKISLDSLALAQESTVLDELGGDVLVTFDPLVPLFNIRSVTSSGKEILSVETAGRISSSDDDSFSFYTGMETLPKDKKRKVKKSKAGEVQASFEGQTLTLDSSWAQSMENLWVLGDVAVLSLMGADFIEESQFNMTAKFSRMGNTHSYPLWKHSSMVNAISENGSASSYSSVLFWGADGEGVTRVLNNIIRTKEGKAYIFSLTVFEDAYQKNRAYFEKIISSWKTDSQ